MREQEADSCHGKKRKVHAVACAAVGIDPEHSSGATHYKGKKKKDPELA